MRVLADGQFYRRTEECLQWLLQISAESPAQCQAGANGAISTGTGTSL